MEFKAFLNNVLKNGSEASTISTQLLKEEIKTREALTNVFPLDVFNTKIKPFISCLNNNFDIPRSFVGLSMLSAYSTAIGSSYVVSPNGQSQIYLPLWGCLCGISSAGKSLAIDHAYGPLLKIQENFDRAYQEEKDGGIELMKIRMPTVIVRDVHIPTLVRGCLPQNPKGVLKYCDEILEWVNGFNSLSKGKDGTDEQFWLSAWNCRVYSGLRSGNDKFVVPRPFVNVIGGIQFSVLYKLFAKDRDTTGFVFRILFALPEVNKISEIDSSYVIPGELLNIHKESLENLYFSLKVESPYEEPKKCTLSSEANKLIENWFKVRLTKINRITDISEMEIKSGILGKIKEYAYRIAGILHLADRSYEINSNPFAPGFKPIETITDETIERSLRLADYFYYSAQEAYSIVQSKIIAPPDVVVLATLRKKGLSFEKIAEILYNDGSKRQKVHRDYHKFVKEYPRIFGTKEK